ncbi:MAG: HD domain-containing protein, partial [[Actinobacillus] rossii]|nr:HD domain-containing protein [[Actinobacillus] rossii]
HHPEIDSFMHTMMVLQQAVLLTENTAMNKSAVRFAAICHDLGKALTPNDMLPHHYDHEKKGVQPVRKLCNRLKVPTYYKELAELTCEYHTHAHKAFELRTETIIKLFNTFDVWRKPQRFLEFLTACMADTRGRLGFEQVNYPQKDYLWMLYQVAIQVDIQQIIQDGFEKQGIRDELMTRRILAIKTKIDEIRPQFLTN